MYPLSLCFGKKHLITLPHHESLCRGMRNLHAPLRKHRSRVPAKYFCGFSLTTFQSWGSFFSLAKNRTFFIPVTMETRSSKVIFRNYSKRNRLEIHSYRRYGEHGEKMFVFLGLFVHSAVRGGTCAFTLKIVNTLIKNSSRDDKPSIST